VILKQNSTHQFNLTLDSVIRLCVNLNLVNRFSFTCVLFVLSFVSFSQISIPSTAAVTENFDAMAASGTAALPANWKISVAGAAAPTWSAGGNFTAVNFQASSGAPATGGRYNWGTTAATDRSLGIMSSGSYASPNSIMAFYRNTNASNLTQLSVSYKGERYRVNTAAASIQFFYSTDGTTWTAVAAGDIAAASFPTGASAYTFGAPLVVNVAAFNITGLNIANNGNIYLRWNLNTTGGNSQGIGIDDVSVTATFATSNTITTGTLTGAPFAVDCTTSASGTVDFTSTGTFNAGNVYTAQLSSSAGSFASPLSIGTLSSTANSGTINITIPATTASGAGYKIRVVSSTPSVIGTETAAFTITLSGGPCGGGGGGVLFTETFDEAANSTTGVDNTGGVSWTATCPGSADAGDYNKVVSGKLEAQDSNGPAFFETNSINTTSCDEGFYIKLDITESGTMEECDGVNGTTAVDWVSLEYSIDGGAWLGPANSYDCTAPTSNTTTAITDGDGNLAYQSPCITAGAGLRLRLTTQTWAADEVWTIDNIEVGCMSCILPVELTYFEAECNDNSTEVRFSWQTYSEKNNDYFIIQRTADGVTFEDLERVEGSGSTSVIKEYEASLPFNRFETFFYRLKQVDFDGKATYSKLTSPICTYDESSITIYPNPSQGNFVIQGYEEGSRFDVYDKLGSLIYTLHSDGFSSKIDLSAYASGIYFVRVISSASNETFKVQVIK
jgi:hypothetical protein